MAESEFGRTRGVGYVLVDLETSGPRATEDEIIEVAVLGLNPDGCDIAWQRLIDPQCKIPSFIQSLTGIRPELLVNAPLFSDISAELWELLDGRILVAHNVRFDSAFLRHAFRREGRQYRPKTLCTLKLARALYPHWPRHSLDAVCAQIGYVRTESHRAMADVLAMKAFLDFARGDRGDDLMDYHIAFQQEGVPPTVGNSLQ